MDIHYCDWASQPTIHIACSGATEPSWTEKGPCSHIHVSDDGHLYTFIKEIATCMQCLTADNLFKENK